jgi:hypothetical protein
MTIAGKKFAEQRAQKDKISYYGQQEYRCIVAKLLSEYAHRVFS